MKRVLISSTKNATLKAAIRLRDRRVRVQRQECLVEGLREIQQALSAGLSVSTIFVCEEILCRDEQAKDLFEILVKNAGAHTLCCDVPVSVYERLVLRESTGGLAVIVKTSVARLADLFCEAHPLVIALERVEKPGNLGAVLRTVDCVGAAGIILIGDSVDLYNPNVIRASLGSCFRIPVVSLTVDEVLASDFLRRCDWCLLTPEGASSLYESDMVAPQILLFGSEAFGIDPRLQELSDKRVAIPMHGLTNSLNLSVSVGVVAYESYRQRQLERS